MLPGVLEQRKSHGPETAAVNPRRKSMVIVDKQSPDPPPPSKCCSWFNAMDCVNVNLLNLLLAKTCYKLGRGSNSALQGLKFSVASPGYWLIWPVRWAWSCLVIAFKEDNHMLVEDDFLLTLYTYCFSSCICKAGSGNGDSHLSILGPFSCWLSSMTSKPVHSEVDFRFTQLFSQVNRMSSVNYLNVELSISFCPSPGNIFAS